MAGATEGKSAMTVLTWTDDRVEQLKKLWEAGLSASQIAAELGNVTRNAVIGKVHRLGLSGRAKSPSSAAPRQRKVRPAQHMMRVSRPVSRGNTDRKRGDRQSTSAGPLRPRQEPLFGGTAPTQGPPRPAHDAGLASGLARQYRSETR